MTRQLPHRTQLQSYWYTARQLKNSNEEIKAHRSKSADFCNLPFFPFENSFLQLNMPALIKLSFSLPLITENFCTSLMIRVHFLLRKYSSLESSRTKIFQSSRHRFQYYLSHVLAMGSHISYSSLLNLSLHVCEIGIRICTP